MPSTTTCDYCDQQAEALASGQVRVLPPALRNFGRLQHFHGRVTTLQVFEDNSLVRAALEEAGMARVLVIDGGGSTRTALMGGNLAALAARNGWAGVVIDGCVRDVAEIAAAPVGVRALSPMPVPPRKLGAGRRDVAVRIQGVWVHPGEWLYADADGIVVSDRPLHAMPPEPDPDQAD